MLFAKASAIRPLESILVGGWIESFLEGTKYAGVKSQFTISIEGYISKNIDGDHFSKALSLNSHSNLSWTWCKVSIKL